MIDNPVISADGASSARIQLQLWLSDAQAVHTASAAELAPADREHLALMRCARRQQEWLVSRTMLRECVAEGHRYSLSHSGGEAALLVSTGDAAIGVDLEVHRPRDWRRKAELVFSRAEVAALRAAPADRAESLFYALWTMKEAMAKALGLELMQALGECRFDPASGDPWSGSVPTDRPWSIHVFTPRPGVTLAAACVGASQPLIHTALWPQRTPTLWPTLVRCAIGHPL